jgi:hypothetical protein
VAFVELCRSWTRLPTADFPIIYWISTGSFMTEPALVLYIASLEVVRRVGMIMDMGI